VLAAGNKPGIRQAILDLRNHEPFEGAIGLLASFYDTSDDNSIRKTINDFMNDLKDNTASDEVMKEIRKPYKLDTTLMLISSCWQSGLDYSEYLDDLVDIFLTSDFIVSIECLSVIEESASHLSEPKKQSAIEHIERYPVSSVQEKAALTSELICVLQQIGE